MNTIAFSKEYSFKNKDFLITSKIASDHYTIQEINNLLSQLNRPVICSVKKYFSSFYDALSIDFASSSLKYAVVHHRHP